MKKLKSGLLSGILFCMYAMASGQLCNGNLGDPIINYSFPASSSNLVPGITTYKFANGCPAPGEYTIDNFLFGCSNNTWHLLTGDHTQDTRGNYLLVNSENATGSIFSLAVGNLCSSTTYQFSAWVMNVMKNSACGGQPVHPDITFTVKTTAGTTLATYNTGKLPETAFKEWNQFGTVFTTPASGVDSVVLSIISVAGLGCGNGFALDDITLKACGPSVTAFLDGSSNASIDLCAGYANPMQLTFIRSAGFIDPVYQWQTSSDKGKSWQDIAGVTGTGFAIPRRANGIILYRTAISERSNFAATKCRIVSNSIWTEVHPAPAQLPLTQLSGCIGSNINLRAPAPALKYEWTYPGGMKINLPDPVISKLKQSDTGLYQLRLIADYGCFVIDSFYLKLSPGTTISVNPVLPICKGNSVTLSANGAGNFKWRPTNGLSNDTIGNPVATPSQTTEYTVLLTNIYGCKDSAMVKITVNEKPEASAGRDQRILKGDTILLKATLKGTDIIYQWSPDLYMADKDSIRPRVYPPITTAYSLKAISKAGCGSSLSTVHVIVYENIFIPGAFTPNGDGKNDKFTIIKLDNYTIKNFTIYNRWGTIIYNQNKQEEGWDGYFNNNLMPQGNYIYILNLQTPGGNIIHRQGSILLIR